MQRTAPPFFKQGPSANLRLALFSLAALVLLVVDARFDALSAMRQGVATVLYPVQRTLLMPREAIGQLGAHFESLVRLQRENEDLRRLEIVNAKTLQRVEQLHAENQQLRRLLGARDRVTVPSVVAEVLYDARDPFDSRLMLDKGTAHGVAPGQPVIDADGLVGQITRVFPLASELTLITHTDLTLPVEIQRTGQRAIATGAIAPSRLELRYLPASADVVEGDVVATSGLDGLYPVGVPIGRIVRIERNARATFIRAEIEPLGGVDRSRMLLVLLVEPRVIVPSKPAGRPGGNS
ncbi:MAG: rod shape-determining protein MreC [Burkholderiales bacterium]|nr:MAG: rod shape-determining protein MreC [Burkholderiales bacterium]